MSEGDYRVVFNGVTTGEFDPETTRRRFARAFKLDVSKTERLFSGKDYVIKSGLTETEAMNYAIKLAEIGCECYFEMVLEVEESANDDPDFVERRRSIRRLRYRRDPRPGSVLPDRRFVSSRRHADLQMLESTGDFPGNSVKKAS